MSIAAEDIVPGDVVHLSAGDLVPADGLLIDASDLFVNQAVMTGESFPVVKKPGAVSSSATLQQRSNVLWMGTNVRSGTARYLVVHTGLATQYGEIAKATHVEAGRDGIRTRPPAVRLSPHDRDAGDSARRLRDAHLPRTPAGRDAAVLGGVGRRSQSRAAAGDIDRQSRERRAGPWPHHGVLVRRLNAIENLGSMDILCTDKTGALTEGVVELEGSVRCRGRPSPLVLELAACNAALETGLRSPLDDAILRARRPDLSRSPRLPRFPSTSCANASPSRLTTRRAAGRSRRVRSIRCCRSARASIPAESSTMRSERDLERQYEAWSHDGIRVLGVAMRQIPRGEAGDVREREMTFAGFVTFLDRPKPDAARDIADLAALGVAVKVITGDNALVARHVATLVGLTRIAC